jgi:hypothetical protein
MLYPDEIKKIREGTWELDCSNMILSNNSSKEAYEGPGYIKCTSDGQIYFKMYSKNLLRPGQGLRWWTKRSEAGKLISKEQCFKLSATDTQGRIWQAEFILPENSGFVGPENNVISGLIPYELKYSYKTPDIFVKADLGIRFFHTVDRYIPCNTITKSSSLNVAKFSSCNCDFTISKKDEILVLGVTSHTKNLPNNIEYRAVEALQFVLAHPLNWTILEKNEEGIETIIIRKTSKETPKCNLNVPICHVVPKDSHTWKLYDKYLSHILNYNGKTNWHPLSIFIHRVLIGSAAYPETFALEATVAVEGLLRTEFESLAVPEDKFLQSLSEARNHINASSLKNELKLRVCGAINAMKRASATDKLRLLVESRVISEKEYKAWKELRNSSAHPIEPASLDLQKLLDLCDTVITLFYKLIFHLIGYEGKYIDYGTYGYPLKDFPSTEKQADPPQN